MPNDPSDNPVEKLLASSQQNIVGAPLAAASQHTVGDYPTPGSLGTTSKLTGQVQCGQCQALNVPTANFCRSCGSPMARLSECPGCHAPVRAHDKFCSQCGKSV